MLKNFLAVSFLLGSACPSPKGPPPSLDNSTDPNREASFLPKKIPPVKKFPPASSKSISILDFYKDSSVPNAHNVALKDMWGWDYSRLEHAHNYIQWMFPLDVRSGVNSSASIIEPGEKKLFKTDPAIKENMHKSLETILHFWGFKMEKNQDSCILQKRADFSERLSNWVAPRHHDYGEGAKNYSAVGNHNFLRVTRVLKSLQLAGLSPEARCFYEGLRELYEEDPIFRAQVGNKSFIYWTNAIGSASPDLDQE